MTEIAVAQRTSGRPAGKTRHHMVGTQEEERVSSMAMNTDVAVLAKEAANFGRISGELTGVIAQVEGTAGALASQMVGQAGTAAQQALIRFHEAAAQQTKQLDDIAANINTGGVQYQTTDDDQASALSSAMNINH